MIRREFGIFDEDFNDGFNNGFDNRNYEEFNRTRFEPDFFRGGGGRGGGGGGIVRGGGGGIRVKGGCRDPKALNYDSNATFDNGSCRYKKIIAPMPSKSIGVKINVNQKDYTVLIDGRPVTEPLNFTDKELLTPKIIRVTKGNFKVNTEYRIYSKTKQQRLETIKSGLNLKPVALNANFNGFLDLDLRLGAPGFGNTAIPKAIPNFRQTTAPPAISLSDRKPIRDTVIDYSYRDYNELIVEKRVDGVFVPVNVPGLLQVEDRLFHPKFKPNTSLPAFPKTITLDFILSQIKIKEPVEYASLTINADVLGDNIIKYTTMEGETGFIKNGTQQLKVFLTDRWVEFSAEALNEAQFDISYRLNTDKASTFGLYRKVNLNGKGSQVINIVVKRKTIDAPDPIPGKTPLVQTRNGNRFSYNVIDRGILEIAYDSANASEVRYSLGTTRRILEPAGMIRLKLSDFTNGIGNYTLYLQGYSEQNGTGPVEKIPINVFSKEILPGPDITHINYPQLLKGADFKGFDVNFTVSWQSVNTNYINIYAGIEGPENALGKFSGAGAATFNVQELLSIAGTNVTQGLDKVQIPMFFIPYNEEGDSKTAGKTEKITVTFDKGDLTLRRGVVVNSIREAWRRNLNYNIFRDEISKFLTHYLHLGGADNKLIATWGVDTETFSEYEDGFRADGSPFRRKLKEEKSLILKLYEPLPPSVAKNDTVWISKLQSIPLIEQVTILDEIAQDCTPLTPNFDLDITDDIGYQILDDLIASGSETSTDLINKFVSGSEYSLENLNFTFTTGSDYNWKDFVKFSSAEERARNFFYKVQTIQFYENKKDVLTTSQPASSSVAVLNEVNKLDLQIKKLENNFDAFEKYLYTTSGSLAYPGAGLNEISASTDSSATSWLNGIVASAEIFDENNPSRISSNLPAHIINNAENEEFTLFFDMIGQHYDVIWAHIKQISKVKKAEHKYVDGIGDDLIYHLLESLGWNADEGVQSQFLWEFAFGKDKDGTQSRALSGKDRQQEVWRRILNNLPYLLKHKGTKRALHALLSCYGVPASLLTIMEFGGPRDVDSSGTSKFTFEDRTASILLSGSASVKIPWSEHSTTSDHPNSVEVRLKTNKRLNQKILSGSDWSLSLTHDTGSLGRLYLEVSGSSTLYSASSDTFPVYNDEYIHYVVNKKTVNGQDIFDFYAKESVEERLKTNIEKRLIVPTISGWTSGSYLEIGGTTLTGSVDEFRLWTTPLSESRIDNHALLPDAIDGNHVSSSTEDLIFRLDFEYPKNRHTGGDPYIKNVALSTGYATYATASNFENVASYPYQYVPYDRTVTATVPSTGYSFANKVRFENQVLLSNLNYRSRATKKSLDSAPIDSDRLGLFFSPIKEINMDILKSLGNFNIDDYIGSPADEYNDNYAKLDELRNYYFQRYTLNLHEYIQLVRYIDKSLFAALESLVPARAKVTSGLLIEPHILERSKTRWNRPTAEENYHESVVDVNEDVVLTSTNTQYTAEISASSDTKLVGSNTQYEGVIVSGSTEKLSGEHKTYSTTIDTESTTILSGVITRNSGSSMAGFEITIDAEMTGSVSGEYDATQFVQVGNDPNGIANQTFGIYAENGHSNITRLDKNGHIIKERKKVYIIKESYKVAERVNIDPNDSSRGTEVVDTIYYKYKVTKLPITGSDGNPTSAPSVAGNVVEVTPLDKYSNQHYKFVEDVTLGLENSFFNGCLQTAATTIDGSAPVQTFTTNPNTLKVSDTGRGSGEPILEVD
jgi:hypothetical protein